MLLLLLGCATTPPPVTTPTPASGAASAGAYGPAPRPITIPEDQAPFDAARAIRTPSGLTYWVLREGDGPVAEQGQTASVHYTGWLADGTRFDSSRERGTPLQVQVGAGRVIRGWDEALSTMRVGEVRRLQIPSSLGYGAAGAGGRIPGGATLIFEVELVALR